MKVFFWLAFLQMLNLSKSHQWKYSQSLEEFLQADLPNHFSELLSRILAESPSTEVFFMILDRVCGLFARQPVTGYMTPPYTLSGRPTHTPRMVCAAHGIAAVTKLCREARSLAEAICCMNQCVTLSNGFIMYQIDMLARFVGRRHRLMKSHRFLPRAHVAGPGMIPLCLELAFGFSFRGVEVDETEVAAQRDEGDLQPAATSAGSKAKAHGGPEKRRKTKSMMKCTPAHYRMSAGACYFIACQLASSDLWTAIREYYGWKILEGVDDVYDLLEYFLCELRRFLYHAKDRRSAGRTELAEAWLRNASAWIDSARQDVTLNGLI